MLAGCSIVALCVVCVACGGRKQAPGPAWNEPEPETGYRPLEEPVTLSPTAAQPGQEGEIRAEWVACASDADCVSLETHCCRYVAVSKKHFADARAVLPYSTCDMLCPGAVDTQCDGGTCVLVLP